MTIVSNNLNYTVLTPDGYKHFSNIRKQTKEAIKITFVENINPIEVTYNHVFLQWNKEIFAYQLNIGDYLDHTLYEKVQIENIENVGKISVYDLLDVDGHIYYTNGLKSHNCEFLGSLNTVIERHKLEELTKSYKSPETYDFNGKLRIWEKPKKDELYVIGSDIAKGTGEHYSTCQVLKIISTDPFKVEQVATFQDNYTDVYTFSNIVYKLALYYNNAYLVIENNIGDTVISQIWWEYEYENLICEGSKSTQLGVRATKKSKSKAVLAMKKLIEDNDLILYDLNTINELTTFIDKGNNVFGGKDLDDDLVDALYWACYITEFDILSEGELRISADDDIEEGWGLLSDIGDSDEDFSWLNEVNL